MLSAAPATPIPRGKIAEFFGLLQNLASPAPSHPVHQNPRFAGPIPLYPAWSRQIPVTPEPHVGQHSQLLPPPRGGGLGWGGMSQPNEVFSGVAMRQCRQKIYKLAGSLAASGAPDSAAPPGRRGGAVRGRWSWLSCAAPRSRRSGRRGPARPTMARLRTRPS